MRVTETSSKKTKQVDQKNNQNSAGNRLATQSTKIGRKAPERQQKVEVNQKDEKVNTFVPSRGQLKKS